MEINLGDEQIIALQPTFSPEQIQEKALGKRLDAFGPLAKLIQRAKPDDIEITTIQKRYEPFWFVTATARYVYDRRDSYRVEAPAEVQSVSLHEHEHPVVTDHGHAFTIEALAHCVEEFRRELVLDAQRGDEADLARYLTYPSNVVSDVSALQQGGTLVVAPEVRGSFVIRKVVSLLVKTFQADTIQEERIDVEKVALFYRPVCAIEYEWKSRGKKQVLEFDALTGEFAAEPGRLKQQVVRFLANDALFDIGADAVGTFLPGANIAVKLGRLAVRKVVR